MLFVFFVSCVQPYVKINSNSLVQPAPTLLATTFVDTKAQEEEVELTDIIQSKDMDAVGFHLITQSMGMLDTMGFQVYLDKEQAQRIDLIKGDWIDSGKSIASVLGGIWFSKETSMVQIDNNTIIFDGYSKALVGKMDTDKENEHFVFISAYVSEIPTSLFMRSPQILIDYVILNEAARVIFRARGIGRGTSSFLFLNKSRKNLSLAIDGAIQSIEQEIKQELP